MLIQEKGKKGKGHEKAQNNTEKKKQSKKRKEVIEWQKNRKRKK